MMDLVSNDMANEERAGDGLFNVDDDVDESLSSSYHTPSYYGESKRALTSSSPGNHFSIIKFSSVSQ